MPNFQNVYLYSNTTIEGDNKAGYHNMPNRNSNNNETNSSTITTAPRLYQRNNSQSQIPLPRFTTSTTMKFSNDNSTLVATDGNRWKHLYEDAEKKRKILVTQTQKDAREYDDLERRHKEVLEQARLVQRHLKDKETSLVELRRVSEAMYREYDQLKNKYEVETGALHEAMKSAHQWYKQNRVLKRQSTIMAQKFLSLSGATIDIDISGDTVDCLDKDDKELDDLKKSVKDLSEEVGRLQTELSSARLEEFEAQEQAVNLTSELDSERTLRTRAEAELTDLREMRNNLDTVSHMVASEMESLRNQCQQEQQVAKAMKKQANQAQKERNVLAHQSTLLLADLTSDERHIRLLQEIESLKRALEEEQQQHAAHLLELQEKLEEQEGDAQMELLEEKLKLAESELQCALHRAERAEMSTKQLSSTVNRLEVELVSKATPPPPPPPPPPPMPPALPLQSRKVPNAVIDMAKMLGVAHKQTSAIPNGGAIDEIINQIKGGRFNLKATEKQKEKKEDVPPAVHEMLTILGTMKRRPKPKVAPADVEL